jgi:hypothetical protein
MLRLFLLAKQQPSPYQVQTLPPPAIRTIPWHVIVRRYSPQSRRSFRRILLAAKARGIRVTMHHDHGMLFRLHLLTGTPAALADFRKRASARVRVTRRKVAVSNRGPQTPGPKPVLGQGLCHPLWPGPGPRSTDPIGGPTG